MAEPPEVPPDPASHEKDPAIAPPAVSDTRASQPADTDAAESADGESGGAGSDEEDDSEDDEEPRLKYTRLTRSLGSVYRNGDSVSCSLVFGERMVKFNPVPERD